MDLHIHEKISLKDKTSNIILRNKSILRNIKYFINNLYKNKFHLCRSFMI